MNSSSSNLSFNRKTIFIISLFAAVLIFCAGFAAGRFLPFGAVGAAVSPKSETEALESRIGPMLLKDVSFRTSGEALSVTADFFQLTGEEDTDLLSYGLVCGAIQDMLLSLDQYSEIQSVSVICRDDGKTRATVTGERIPARDQGAINTETGKILPFGTFHITYPDGSDGGTMMFHHNSQQ